MIWTVCAGHFLGSIGGATTFASAKVKNAIGRIGIFFVSIPPSGSQMYWPYQSPEYNNNGNIRLCCDTIIFYVIPGWSSLVTEF